MDSKLHCIYCPREYLLLSGKNTCECGGLLDVDHSSTLESLKAGDWLKQVADRWGAKSLPDSSGVWRYRELILPGFPEEGIISKGEGNTRLYDFPRLTEIARVEKLKFKHEGENPTGSFKDRGMTVAISWAKRLGSLAVVCASTGNTAASAASYARSAGMKAFILISSERVAMGKVSQSIAYGARVIKVRGNFDDCMKLVSEHASDMGLYVVNSVNPVRLEGQKTIIWELLEQLDWKLPKWIVVPGGNLGNTSAFGKAFQELYSLGILDIDEIPRLAVIQASGASPFYKSWKRNFDTRFVDQARTCASAIEIGDPVNRSKAMRSVVFTKGVVEAVSDEEIMSAKALLDREGVGAEPASAATLAGLLKLRSAGTIRESDTVICVLTGHMLKDPDATIRFHTEGDSVLANKPIVIDPTLPALKSVL